MAPNYNMNIKWVLTQQDISKVIQYVTYVKFCMSIVAYNYEEKTI